jgi:hypothetical protein
VFLEQIVASISFDVENISECDVFEMGYSTYFSKFLGHGNEDISKYNLVVMLRHDPLVLNFFLMPISAPLYFTEVML